jgi:hypothetical protein
MDLCKEIIDQLSGDAVNKLGSLIDSDGETTSNAIQAAVPALLSGLAGLASREDGTKRLTNAFSQLGPGGIDDFARSLSGDANAVAQKGSSLLNSLFGDTVLSGLTNAISRYAGLAGSSVKGLLAFLAPLVLGKVANLWRSRGATPQALTNLFAEQREHIADAAPGGLSLSEIPGWPSARDYARDAVRSANATGRRAVAVGESAGRSAATWAIPLALLLAGALLFWAWRSRSGREATAERTDDASRKVTAMKPVAPETPALPTVASVTKDLQGLYDSAGEVMANIKDAASAEAARPKLEELSAKIDATRKLLAQLPADGQAAVQRIADEQLPKFQEQAEATLQTPGLSADLKSLIGRIVQKLVELFAPATS